MIKVNFDYGDLRREALQTYKKVQGITKNKELQYEIALIGQELVDEYIPYVSGDLKDNFSFVSHANHVSIRYDEPYADKEYYEHGHHPGKYPYGKYNKHSLAKAKWDSVIQEGGARRDAFINQVAYLIRKEL